MKISFFVFFLYHFILGNDLDSIRALFSEKEKELTLAVAKVEALTRQLEDLRRDRRGPLNLMSNAANTQLGSPAARELEKLRRELMVYSIQYQIMLHYNDGTTYFYLLI